MIVQACPLQRGTVVVVMGAIRAPQKRARRAAQWMNRISPKFGTIPGAPLTGRYPAGQ